MRQPIYLDNAATSFPKPPQVSEAMIHYMNEVGANPGRSGHQLSLEASRVVQHTRESLATLFNISDAKRIVFTMILLFPRFRSDADSQLYPIIIY